MAESKNYIVYKHTSPCGKVYIGITRMDCNKRWQNGKGYVHNEYFYRAIEKYGWENFKHEILFENLDEETASNKEVELIKTYKSNEKEYGYNISTGGTINKGWKLCEETKDRLRKRQKEKGNWKGEKNPFYNSHRNGELNPFYGKKHNEETRNKMSENHCDISGDKNPMRRKEVAEKFFGSNNPKSRKVEQYDLKGNYIKTWDCIKDVERELNINASNISSCCRGKYKYTHGFIFRYAS